MGTGTRIAVIFTAQGMEHILAKRVWGVQNTGMVVRKEQRRSATRGVVHQTELAASSHDPNLFKQYHEYGRPMSAT